jgi:hypothetical protein
MMGEALVTLKNPVHTHWSRIFESALSRYKRQD